MIVIDPAIQEKATLWLNSNIDEDSKADIRRMMESENPDELTDAFYKNLEFGTGGLRGIMGVGSNRVNKYTIGMATQGFANYLNQSFPDEEIKVAIAYDSRNNSQYFGEITAAVFSANGIKVYLFEELRPTPELSYSIRKLGCKGGVVLTASHNPKEYNGYKAYWDDGGQVTSPHDKNIVAEVAKISGVEAVKFDADESKIERITTLIDEPYLEAITTNVVSPEAIKNQHDLKIVFSPIHGTGITMVPPILEKIGFSNVHVVEAQATPDGNFPTVVYPNPEESEAMSMALQLAKDLDADLVMGTDPDADRVGIGVKNHKGEWQLMNGNQAASCMIYYLLKAWKEKGKLNGKQYIAKTIVTTDLLTEMATAFEVETFHTLTGFKYIAQVLKEQEGKMEFIGGGEESYGYLVNDFVRDKDAIISCAVLAEVVAYAKDQGLSLFDMLMEIYQQFGMYREHLISIKRTGKKGAEEIQQMMADMRANPPKEIQGSPVVTALDYQSLTSTNLTNGETSSLDFPQSNVLQFITADGTKVSARPSGTEPKIKFYFSVKAPMAEKSDFDAVYEALGKKIDGIVDDLNLN
ncbi:MAG: phospho-sugar mutase [Bacteroidia bacterium]|nr:phospho-sugar mutase [Bacteroidia bacterium]